MNEIVYWVKQALAKWNRFDGRSRRREYWYFALAAFAGNVVGVLLDGIFGTSPIVQVLVSLALFIPGLAVTIRRLHDTGKSGWWLLAAFVPIIGALAILYFMILDSQPDANAYGPSPKANG